MGYKFTVEPDDDGANTFQRIGSHHSSIWTMSDDEVLVLDDAVSARATAIRQARWEARPGPAPAMGEYLVTWSIDVDDETGDPREVAKAAMESFTRQGSIAHVFMVQARDRAGKPIGEPVQVDLDYDCECRCQEGRHCGGCGHAGCGYLPE